jgi:hypothetical protein
MSVYMSLRFLDVFIDALQNFSSTAAFGAFVAICAQKGVLF